MKTLPIIDVGPLFTNDKEASKVIEQIKRASIEWGGFYMTNHGISESIVENAFKYSKELFKYKNIDDKDYQQLCKSLDMEFANGHEDKLQKCVYYGKSSTLDGKLPLKENIKNAFNALIDEMCGAASKLLRVYEMLLGLPESSLPYGRTSELGSFHYLEPEDKTQLQKDTTPKDTTQKKISEHTDWGWMTFLFADEPSLQAMDRDGVWHDIGPTPGAIVVNVSDALELVSGGLFRAFPHKVICPSVERSSIAFFVDPPFDFNMKNLASQNIVGEKLKDVRWPLHAEAPITYKKYFEMGMDGFYPSWRKEQEHQEHYR